MIIRILAISILSLEVLASPVEAISEVPLLTSQQRTSSTQSNDRWMALAAIGIILTPLLGSALYRQHLAYKKALYRSYVENLEKMWERSKSR
jgi:hypothetical protein